MMLSAGVAVVLGQDGGGVNLVTQGHGAATAPSGPGSEATEIVDARCLPWSPGQLRYEVRYDDGTAAIRVAAPVGGALRVTEDPVTGMDLPSMHLEYSERADGTWTCSPRYGR
jgi:hypothetical protein